MHQHLHQRLPMLAQDRVLALALELVLVQALQQRWQMVAAAPSLVGLLSASCQTPRPPCLTTGRCCTNVL